MHTVVQVYRSQHHLYPLKCSKNNKDSICHCKPQSKISYVFNNVRYAVCTNRYIAVDHNLVWTLIMGELCIKYKFYMYYVCICRWVDA